MESIKISFNILIPILLYIASGMLLRRTNVLDGNAVKGINAMSFKYFLSIMMFNSIYKSSISILKWDLILYVTIAISLAFGLCFLLVPLLEKDNGKRGVLIQGMVRSNFAVYGYAVATQFCNAEEVGLTALVGAVVLPVYGIYSTIALSVYSLEGKKFSTKKVLKDIAQNPLVLAGVFGVLVLISGIKLPSVIETCMNAIGTAATPVSLIGLGGFLKKGVFKGLSHSIVIGTVGKLIVMPAIFLTAAALLGFRGASLAICLAIFCTPTATASFAMTQQMRGDDKLAAGLIVCSCVCSFITMFVFITLFHGMGLF